MKPTHGLRAMAVDGDAPARDGLRLMLRLSGFSDVLGAPDVDTAWRMMRAAPVDLVVSEWRLAPYGGEELLSRVRSHPNLARTPFILVSASLGEAAWRDAIAGGASEFLYRPFCLEQLRVAAELAMAIEGYRRIPQENPRPTRTAATIHCLRSASRLRAARPA